MVIWRDIYLEVCTNGSIWWKDLKRVCQMGGIDGWFKNNLRRKVGRGDNLKFWDYYWARKFNLKKSSNVNSDQKEASIRSIRKWRYESWIWSLLGLGGGWRVILQDTPSKRFIVA